MYVGLSSSPVTGRHHGHDRKNDIRKVAKGLLPIGLMVGFEPPCVNKIMPKGVHR